MQVDHDQTIEERPWRSALSVLHVTQPTREGVAVVVLDLARDQVKRGWAVTVASPANEAFVAEVASIGAEHRSWPARREPGPSSGAEAVRLARILRATDPDVVHLHSSKAGLAGRLGVRGRRPTVFQPHAWSFEAVAGVRRRGALVWERVGARWADAIICVSEGERLRAKEAGIRAPARVIPNGVDLTRFSPASDRERRAARTRFGLPDGPLVVCVGRLSRQKGQDVLLAAWPSVLELVPEAHLAFVGDGPERERLRRGAAPAVIFAGARLDVPDWLAAADVVAAPSRWEGMSLAVLEALARGRAVVTTNTAGAAEVLAHAPDAIAPIEDAAALANALVARLLDPARAQAEGLAGRARVEREFDVRLAAERVAALYAELMNASSSTPDPTL